MNELHFVRIYADIQLEINLSDIRIIELEADKRYYLKQLKMLEPHELSSSSISGLPGAHQSPISIDRAFEKIMDINNAIDDEQHHLWDLCERQKSIQKAANGFQGLHLKVALMRFIDGKTLQQIADELNYSKGYLKHVSAGIRNL